MHKWLKRFAYLLLISGILLGIFAVGINYKISRYKSFLYTQISDTPTSSIALVFGAGLKRDGNLSDALKDRVESAGELYKEGKVKKLLMTGDNSTLSYDEVTAMKRYATSTLGIKEEDVVLDYAGFDTYDSCYRARDIFDLKEVTAVSQEFHLPRILYTCNKLGVKTIGYKADKHVYINSDLWTIREFLARVKAGLEVEIFKTKPKFLGKKEKVF